jgi:YD repeat-containing protein
MTGRTRFLPLALLTLLAGGPLLTTPSLAQISFVQAQGTGSSANVAQVSATFSSAQQGGHLNVAMIGWRDSTSIQSVTDTAGNSYVLAVGPTALSGMGSQALYYAKNIVSAAAGANTVTVQFASTVSQPDIRIAEYSGVDTTNPFEAGVAATGNGVTMNSGPLTTSNANDLLVAGNTAQFFTELTGDPGYAGRVITPPTGRLLQDRIATAAGPYNATAMQDPSGGWIMQLAAFKPNDTQPPTTPTNLSATATSSTQINLSWNASTDNVAVTGYIVERCWGANCSNFFQMALVTTPAYNDPNVAPSTSYTYRIRAQDAVPNLSGYSSTASATTPADTQAPTAPTSVSASAVASTQINLSWTASTDNVGVTNYLVERCEGASCSNFAQIATPTTTSYNDTGRSASTTYRYQVRSRDAAPNFSAYSSAVSATTPAGPDAPTTPTNLSATAVSSSQINLSWTASTDNVAVTGYRVERCQLSGCSNFAQIATTTTTSYSDSGRAASTTYRYRVRAQDVVPNFSGYSSVETATTPAVTDTQAPTAPTNLSATAASSTQINLSWTASTDNIGVTGYLIERCQGASCSNFAQIATPISTSYNDTGRSPSTSYRYRVRAQDAVPNFSGYSSIVSATTPADTQAPTTPTNLSATAVSTTQINLSWTASTDNIAVTGYLVERCQGASCSNFAQIATPTTTSYNDAGRTASTTYRYRVRAQDAVPNFSAYSTIASATTSGAGDTQAPTAPSGLTAGAISSSQVNLSWTASTDNVGVTGYRIERCTGVSCANFSQIGAPATTSYSDTGLSTSTTYRYRVRAADAADNLSGYSGIVTVITHANSGSSTTTYTYDDAGRLIRAVSSTGRTIEYEYDANGNITVIERQ